MSQTGSDRDLMAEEEQLWTELHQLIDTLPADKVEEPGYFAEGWTAKDLVAHLGSWLAEAGVVLERIRFGTYRPEEIDIDAMNQQFFDSLHDVAYPDVRAQAITAREPDAAVLGRAPRALARGRPLDRQGGPRALRRAPPAPPGVGAQQLS